MGEGVGLENYIGDLCFSRSMNLAGDASRPSCRGRLVSECRGTSVPTIHAVVGAHTLPTMGALGLFAIAAVGMGGYILYTGASVIYLSLPLCFGWSAKSIAAHLSRWRNPDAPPP